MKTWISCVLSLSLVAGGSSFAYAATTESEPAPSTDASSSAVVEEELDGELLAQYFPTISGDQRNITVIGTGRASAPADFAELQMFFSVRDNLVYPDYSVEPPVYPTPPTLRRSDLQPVVDAIVAAGIPASDIDVYVGSTPPVGYVDYYTSPRIQVRIDQPSHSQIQSVIDAANGVVADSDLFYIGQTGAYFGLNSCEGLEANTHQDALNAAQSRAESLANAAGLNLGEVIGISGGDAYPVTYGVYSCPSNGAAYSDPYMTPPPYNPFTPLEVMLNTSVTVVYELLD
jgi:uncharacterized protein YggE